MKPRKPIKRSSPPRRSTTPTRKTPVKPVNRKRRASEFARAYGSKERVAWVKALGCLLRSHNCNGPIDNAHTATSGTGRKAGAGMIIPLCRYHHQRFDEYMWPFNDEAYRDAMKIHAYQIDQNWHAHCARVSQERTPNG